MSFLCSTNRNEKSKNLSSHFLETTHAQPFGGPSRWGYPQEGVIGRNHGPFFVASLVGAFGKWDWVRTTALRRCVGPFGHLHLASIPPFIILDELDIAKLLDRKRIWAAVEELTASLNPRDVDEASSSHSMGHSAHSHHSVAVAHPRWGALHLSCILSLAVDQPTQPTANQPCPHGVPAVSGCQIHFGPWFALVPMFWA